MAWEEHDRRSISHEGVTALRQTDDAVLADVDGEEVWIPQSQIHEDSEVFREGDEGKLVVTKWIGRKKGFWEDD